ncbi:MAG: flavocytochrome c [Burkholderiales bacterium]
MDRRDILKLGTFAMLAGPSAFAAARHERADVIVIGSGGAGMTSAITAFDAKTKVVVLEKMPITGGNTQLAAGGMNAAETMFQKKRGIGDSVQTMFDDTFKGGQKLARPALVQILARDSASSIDWLTGLGADMSDVGRMGGATVDRTHRPSGGKVVGQHIIHVMRQNAIKRGMDVRTNSKALKILESPGGAVSGVLVQNRFGEIYTIEGPVVILASGGFSSNLERVVKYRPEYAGFSSTNQPGATGDGLDLAAEFGAKLVDIEQIQIHPTQAAGSKILITEAVRGNGAIVVNREGKRFMNELTTRDAASAAVLKQAGRSAFLIFDETIRRSLSQIEGYFHLELVRSGGSVAELAKVLGVDGDSLVATVDSYNRFQAAKKDSDFGRPDMPRPLIHPGFHAIEIRPGIHYTMGGVAIDTRARVLGQDGRPVPGLFAAGEVTGGVHGGNRLGGNSISETITFGRIAGREATQFARENRRV